MTFQSESPSTDEFLYVRYQPKSVGKMAGFDTLTLCISLHSCQNVYPFLQGLSYRVLSVFSKEFHSQPPSVFKLTTLPNPCGYGLDVT